MALASRARGLPTASRASRRLGRDAATTPRARTTTPRKSRRSNRSSLVAVRALADDDDLEPKPREYTGELRANAPLVAERVVELPAMLFPAAEVLLPGSAQTLHLYEARFLALLDHARNRTGGAFAHVTFAPDDEDDVDGGTRLCTIATLCRIEDVEKDETSGVGAVVTVIGESRLELRDVRNDPADSTPYLVGVFAPVPVMQPDGSSAYLPSEEEMDEVADLTEYIDTAVGDVVALADALLEGEDAADAWSDVDAAAASVRWGHAEVGNLRRAMAWVEAPYITLDDIPDLRNGDAPLAMEDADWLRPMLDETVRHSELQVAERLSFACLQIAPASGEADLVKLANCRAIAMSTSHGLMDRLKLGQIVLDEQRNALRAKVALKGAFSSSSSGGGGGEDRDGEGDGGAGGASSGAP